MKTNIYKLNTKLPEPISISFHTFYYQENVILTLEANGFTGLGEAAPFKPITGDSQAEVLEQAEKLREIDLDPNNFEPEKLHEILDEKNITSETLRAAVDFAYHDLVAKIKNIPVFKLYADTPTFIDNSVTIFVKDSFEETASDAKKVFNTFPDLKILKIKLKGEHDVERAKAIKNVAPQNMKFLIDANQGYKDPQIAVNDLTQIGDILENVILVEQPTPKEDLVALKYVKDNMKNMLVFADESAATVSDAKKVIETNSAHGINIKLQKAGGIHPAKQIAKMCEGSNYKIMVGCMLEGPVGIAAGIHFADSTKNLILTDLDGDLTVENYANKLPFISGQRQTTDQAGLGINLEWEKIKSHADGDNLIFEKIM